MGSRSKIEFVPPEFVVPFELSTDQFKLRMLSIDDVEADFEAVMTSAVDGAPPEDISVAGSRDAPGTTRPP